MEDLNFNLDSIETWYGENVLTSVIQIDERIQDLASHFQLQESLNDFERLQVVDRLHKIAALNKKIQDELALQMQKLNQAEESLTSIITPG